ncbi:MAG: septum formation initiator family protein, partial [Bacteroidia bacterium]|nr:septum formation initiator family protein [Bacteroidia bacterium]
NRYALALTVYAIWMTFFDAYNVGLRFKLASKLRRLETDQIYYLNKIEELKLQNDLLKRDGKAVEKLAREKYLMKKDNEDLYVVRRQCWD